MVSVLPVRLAVLAACAAMIAVLSATLDGHRACQAARLDVFDVATGSLAVGRERPALRTIQQRCRGTEGLVAASTALLRQGLAREALALAYRAARREPSSAPAWNAFAFAARRAGRPALAARAHAEALRLSPLGQ